MTLETLKNAGEWPNIEYTVDNWIDWALKHKQEPIVISFLTYRPEMFEKVDPRNWGLLATIYRDGMSYEEIKGHLQNESVAVEFIGFIKAMVKLPSLDDVINDPENIKLPSILHAHELYHLVRSYGARVTHENFDALVTFIYRLDKRLDVVDEWVILFLTTVTTVDENLVEHPAYIKMVMKFKDRII